MKNPTNPDKYISDPVVTFSSGGAAEVISKSLEAPALDPVLLSVANMYLAGNSISSIAEDMRIPEDVVTSLINKKEVKAYVDTVYLSQGYLNRMKRMDLVNQVIDAKLQEALETGIYSKKDLLDWLKMINEMDRDARPKEGPGTQVNVQVNNYDKLMKDLLE